MRGDSEYWDEYGMPRLPPPHCPECGRADLVHSSFDHMQCERCSWHGSLEEMHRKAERAL